MFFECLLLIRYSFGVECQENGFVFRDSLCKIEVVSAKSTKSLKSHAPKGAYPILDFKHNKIVKSNGTPKG